VPKRKSGRGISRKKVQLSRARTRMMPAVVKMERRAQTSRIVLMPPSPSRRFLAKAGWAAAEPAFTG
jgi:hypothetical protein